MPKLTDPPRLYLGIDPGQNGGIAMVDSDGGLVFLEKMPATEAVVWDMINEYCGSASKATIEKVHSMPKQGVASTFKFGCGYGGLRMALVAAFISFEEVTPQAWQKALGVSSRGKNESKADHKKKLLSKAQNLFPRATISLKTADSLLIAEYCRRKCLGIL